MGSARQWVIPLHEVGDQQERQIGGKAAKLGRLMQTGFQVPAGFCISVAAYEEFLEQTRLTDTIGMELGRKPFASMRWEEIWDAALRIRSAFLSAPIPVEIATAIVEALEILGDPGELAVRSSAPGEDSGSMSFAGLHESIVGVVGHKATLDAVRVVWASLWSDAALLYRHELALDPSQSRMAVVVQVMINQDRSGVAFGCDPLTPALDRAIVEAVPGLCRDLVDGAVDPDRWFLKRSSGEILEWQAGKRDDGQAPNPILSKEDLKTLYTALRRVEEVFGWPPDMEWTGRADHLTLLQARPITTAATGKDERAWYLTLRPGAARLKTLCARVSEELIPQLEAEGERYAAEKLETLDDEALAVAIETRLGAVQRWKQIYRDEFIPFAHGVRHFATYYNDAVLPEDPYEFVGLLKGQQMLATQRNRLLEDLADQIRKNSPLQDILSRASEADDHPAGWDAILEQLREQPEGIIFVDLFEGMLENYLDVTYGNQRLKERPDLYLRFILEMARSGDRPRSGTATDGTSHDETDPGGRILEQRLFEAVGESRQKEALEVLNIARLSWRLRDDDNLLVGRLESQLLRAIQVGIARLRAAGRLGDKSEASEKAGEPVIHGLRNPDSRVILPVEETPGQTPTHGAPGVTVRQLVGQPGSPGLATGLVRRIRGPEDLGRFRTGEVLVCDAIQPNMTHLVPLACAVVERRGGMLIHGAIIARELGLPCVNGIANVVDLLQDGELISVDGHLGIVTVGEAEFDLEGV